MLPLSGITMAWCGANSEAEIRLFLVFPIKGKWLALFEVGLVFFAFGYPHWIQGIAFVLPLALFWFLGTGKIPLPVGRRFFVPKAPLKKTEREFDKYRDEIHRRATEREEKERLRKLFESSLIDDPEDKKDK